MHAYEDTDWDIAYRNAFKCYMNLGYGTLIAANLARAKAELETGKEG